MFDLCHKLKNIVAVEQRVTRPFNVDGLLVNDMCYTRPVIQPINLLTNLTNIFCYS